MSGPAESEVTILSLREGGFIVWRGERSSNSYNPPARAATTLGEALTYVASIMGPGSVGSGQKLADATSKKATP